MRRISHTIRLGPTDAAFLFFGIVISVGFVAFAQVKPAQRIELPVSQPGFQSGGTQNVTITFAGLAATFTASSPMTVLLDEGGKQRAVGLPAEFSQMDSARLYGVDRIVVTGMINGDASEVVVIDLKQGVEVDHFLCYSPSISPNGRYVAFIKFYPSHGVSNVEDHYMVYDISLSPEQNRPAEIPHHPGVVGHVVFPVGIPNSPSDNVDIENRPTHRMASDGFFWDDLSTKVVFVDEFQDEFAVVVATTMESTVKVDTVEISRKWICPSASEICAEHLARTDFLKSPNPSIELTFRGVSGTPARQSKVLLSPTASEKLAASPIK